MSLKKDKALALLGLAMKAHSLVSGEFQTLEAVKSQKAVMVMIAEDASANTKKLFHDKCSFYEVPVYEYGTKEDLGRAIGKDLRSSLAVCDAGLAEAVIRQLETR
ncbi:MAG: ribosomal L7Ae/L30e/S12e/Gadd45 family protein [Roseburia sp.]|nr:ribosomal L7Ae/L30e/S12e/Gadd45 family protein [Roseburia sp.]